ncbi:MAG: carnitine dehydratase [Rickettsiales bacterium]|nr:carnitine dehydratase [Rickettsiales bacterium]
MKNFFKNKLVVSIEQAVAAPYCTAKLADAGARVIKIERKEGDFARYYDNFVKGQSTYFVWLNRGKESLIADIKNKADVELIKNTISKADIFVQNLGPNALNKVGLDSKSLRKINNSLITCDISGYGATGPYSKLKAYDLLVQAEVGLCSLTGTEKEPGRVGVSVCDIACGLNAYSLILEALIKKSYTGKGSSIKLSLFESLSEWMNVPFLQYKYTKSSPKRVGLAHPSIVPYGCFLTKDKKNILFSIQNEREWVLLSKEILKIPNSFELKYNTPSLRLKNKKTLNNFIIKKIKTIDSKKIVADFKKYKIAFGLLNSIEELSRHPQLKLANIGKKNDIKFIPPITLHNNSKFKKVPKLGEHSIKIRKEFSIK